MVNSALRTGLAFLLVIECNAFDIILTNKGNIAVCLVRGNGERGADSKGSLRFALFVISRRQGCCLRGINFKLSCRTFGGDA